MAEEKLPDYLTGLGHVFDPTQLARSIFIVGHEMEAPRRWLGLRRGAGDAT